MKLNYFEYEDDITLIMTKSQMQPNQNNYKKAQVQAAKRISVIIA